MPVSARRPAQTPFPRSRWAWTAVVALAVLLLAGSARGQHVVAPPLALSVHRSDSLHMEFGALDVAVEPNSSRAVVVWADWLRSGNSLDDATVGIAPFSLVNLRPTFRTARVPLAPYSAIRRTRVTALTEGLLATWTADAGPGTTGTAIWALPLGSAGVPVGSAEQRVTPDDAFNLIGHHTSAGLRSGAAVVAWKDFDGFTLRIVSRNGEPLGLHGLATDTGPNEARIEVDATFDGGFIVAWQPTDGARAKAERFSAQGLPLGDAFAVGAAPFLQAVAASPAGDVVAALFVRGGPSEATSRQIWLARFTSAGAALGSEQLVHTAGSDFVVGDLAFDFAGNLYVAWVETMDRTQARGYDASGVPLGPPVLIGSSGSGTIHVARTPDGDFVNMTYPATTASVVSLCVPGSSVCGDGALDSLCERCDDGAANSDTAPDVCRTNCRPARCGDGTIDTGESCDDGNRNDCDGCNGVCQVEAGLGCGDGVPFPTCGEVCDDGNQLVGDGCSPTCTAERALGGGPTGTDCYVEWSIDNPTNVPLFDAAGNTSNVQRCVDNDARCDRDGGVAGRCTVAVRVCANNTNVAACEPSSRIASWVLRLPSAKQAVRDPAAAAIRAAFAAGVNGAIVGPTTQDLCSPEVLVTISVKPGSKLGKRTVKTRANLYGGAHDDDSLRLVCTVAGL